MLSESPKRSIIKAITWRVTATITTMLVVFFISKDFTVAITVGFVETVIKLMIFYFHERIWNKVPRGVITK